ncbi:MAG: pyruvate kinase [Thermus sp.]|uniref:pyruvate kinase n=1 Tax=Thermus sp. TaxID=275 RepID=UPI0025F26577|nr:pyruvate kinase [Thermus sp.]MCS7218494.1 pyruvate kinase [Thermus sp.]
MEAQSLLDEVRRLRQAVEAEAPRYLRAWGLSPPFDPALLNLARYLALRRRDLRPLQRALMLHGLSSLGRLESRVAETLEALERALAALAGEGYAGPLDPGRFFQGEERLRARTQALFGPPREGRLTRIMATLPEGAWEVSLLRELGEVGMDVVRLNLGKLPEEAWEGALRRVRAAGEALGRPLPLVLDLEGPRVRILTRFPAQVRTGDLVALELSGQAPEPLPAFAPDRPGLLQLEEGAFLSLDEGRLLAQVEEATPYGFLLRVRLAPPKGFKLKPGKALNAPLTPQAPYLGEKDQRVLELAQREGALVGLSFVRRPEDLKALPQDLPGVVLKLESREGVENLPALLATSWARFPTAAMIARGDLGVELGPERAAEMEEELLWLLEAAHTPAVWATHVLDRLVKKGSPSRAELADAVMGSRAEVVMLNQGPFLREGVALLDGILRRMEAHQYKKTPRLRALGSWPLP